jgi:hypothetical protein
MYLLGGVQKRPQQADRIQDVQGARLDSRGPRLAVRLHVPLDEPRLHTVAGELGGREQPRWTGADDQDVVPCHCMPPEKRGGPEFDI